MHLGKCQDPDPVSAHEIAEAIKVPGGYLQRILRALARAGITVAQRGSGAGFLLAKPSSAITVLDVLLASDTQVDRIERCPLGIKGHTSHCALHRLLDDQIVQAERTFFSTTIADLIEPNAEVRPLCDPESGFWAGCGPVGGGDGIESIR